MVNYKKIIADTNSKHYNVGDLYKNHRKYMLYLYNIFKKYLN